MRLRHTRVSGSRWTRCASSTCSTSCGRRQGALEDLGGRRRRPAVARRAPARLPRQAGAAHRAHRLQGRWLTLWLRAGRAGDGLRAGPRDARPCSPTRAWPRWRHVEGDVRDPAQLDAWWRWRARRGGLPPRGAGAGAALLRGAARDAGDERDGHGPPARGAREHPACALVVVTSDKCYTSISQPVRRLRAFERVTLAPGADRTVSFTLDRSDFGFYDNRGRFVVEPGGSTSTRATARRRR